MSQYWLSRVLKLPNGLKVFIVTIGKRWKIETGMCVCLCVYVCVYVYVSV